MVVIAWQILIAKKEMMETAVNERDSEIVVMRLKLVLLVLSCHAKAIVLVVLAVLVWTVGSKRMVEQQSWQE